MRHDLNRLRELNARTRTDSSSLVVPIIPTISMMAAAADATNVFALGDRLGDWLLPPEETGDPAELTNPELANALGVKRAYELQVMAEIWAGCISGLIEWSRKRGIEGSNLMVDSWFRPHLSDCPEIGWPEKPHEVLDVHKHHSQAAYKDPPFAHQEFWLPHADLAFVLPAPRRCSSIMAMRAGQRAFLMDYLLLWLDDLVDMDRIPFVPGFSIESAYDEEERHRILAAAAWNAAVGEVQGLSDDDPHMPLPPKSAAVFISRLAEHARVKPYRSPSYHHEAPFRWIEVSNRSARLVLSTFESALTCDFSDGVGGGFNLKNPEYRLPSVQELLINTIRQMVSSGDVEVTCGH